MAGRIKRFSENINIHYFSFEIFFHDELKAYPKMLAIKNKEIYYSKNAHTVVIQDNERKCLLMTENKLPTSTNWCLIPVSPAHYECKPTKKKYNKSSFGLKETDVVYVHSGSVSPWAGINQIIEAIEKGLPDNTYIFIHNRSKFNKSDGHHRQLFELKENGANLILHDGLFESYDEYYDFLLCFDYGITIYDPDGGIFTGKNIEEIGLASGKFSTYMMLGLPTILSKCNTYKQIINDYAIGQIINDKNDLSYHINNHSLSKCKKSDCEQFYSMVLDPTKAIDSFINALS
ncbi:hypothetical protein G7074_16210 [Pedobacter sp. HDW13]|uniref:hypothetical protein n=1 Tax=Pedobacter sp. HDW13 TaxID=2714940 RepID=UPI00140A6988|nr:hypothetical protein [Pedobacter sp. HDW13]QIL40672.1 hypothetical protein G7074_16210 [Pedobacter sp. HDW13]